MLSTRQLSSVVVLGVALLMGAAPTAHAQSYFAANELAAGTLDLDPNSQFGISIDAQPGRAVIGAPRRHFDDELSAGAAYVYRKVGGNWSVEQEFVAPVPEGGALFGTSVAIDGEKAAVGAPREDRTATDGGVVYIFDRNFVPVPTTVFRGDYIVPFGSDVEWIEWPEFRTDVEFDPNLGVVFEFNMPEGGTTFQLFKNRSNGNFQTYRRFANGDATTAITLNENTQYNTRFLFVSKKSIAQSNAYATGLGDNEYGGFYIDSDIDRPGTGIRALWGGSFDGEDPLEFSEAIAFADGATHIAFRFELTANPFTGLVPRVFSVSVAYVVPDEGF